MENPGEDVKNDEKIKERKTHMLELLIVIMLGVTALLTAWASWIGSQHGGNQDANFAMSNNLSALGNSEYNAGIQFMMQDMLLYNELMSISIDMHFAEVRGDWDTYERLDWKIEQLITNMSDDFLEAFLWAAEQSEILGESVSPFENDDLMGSYFAAALDLLDEAEDVFQRGMEYSSHSDAFGLVSVFFTVSLFLLGITSGFKNEKNKRAIFFVAAGSFLIAFIYMLFLPMPTDFSLLAFFGGN